MKIGHYDSDLWVRGGVANYICQVGRAQAAQGHEVIYFSLHPPTGHPLKVTPFVPVLNTAELFAQAESLELDILHLHKVVSSPLTTKVPLVRTVHGHHPYCPSGGRYLNRWQQPCNRTYHPLGCLRGYFVDHCGSIRPNSIRKDFQYTQTEIKTLSKIPVITVSEFLRQQMIYAGYSANKIQSLHLFTPQIGSYESPPSKGIPHFLFLGRITKKKGLDWLIKALHQVKEPIHLDIAGEGEYLKEIRFLVRALRLQNRVTFHGWVNTCTANELIKSSRALIFPSVWHEPAGLVAFEAMANARAVVASQVGGILEIVEPGINGLAVEPWDINELAKALTTLAQNLELAQTLGQSGYEKVKDYTLEKHLSKLMNIYSNIVKPQYSLC